MGPFLEGLIKNIPVLGQIAGGLIDAQTAKQNTDRTISANKGLAEYQYSKDLEMWNRGNAYNSPEAQMERLKRAGLNPNLVYGNGAVGNTSAQLPKYNAPSVEYNYKPPVDIPAVLGMYQDFQIKQAQIDNLRAQRNNIEAETINKRWMGGILESKEMMSRTDRMYKPDMAFQALEKLRLENQNRRTLQPYQFEFAKGRNSLLEAQINKLMQETEYTETRNRWFTTQLFSKLGLEAFNSISKLFPASRMYQGAKATKAFPQGFNKVRYNSPTSWKNAGY